MSAVRADWFHAGTVLIAHVANAEAEAELWSAIILAAKDGNSLDMGRPFGRRSIRDTHLDPLLPQDALVIVSKFSWALDDFARGAEFLLDQIRLNVAVSRAKTLAIVVGNFNLVTARFGTVRKMELAVLFCWLVEYSRNGADRRE